jgi:ATP-dependent DNA ligase
VKPPAGPGWVHEIKHDGYRLQVRRAERVNDIETLGFISLASARV